MVSINTNISANVALKSENQQTNSIKSSKGVPQGTNPNQPSNSTQHAGSSITSNTSSNAENKTSLSVDVNHPSAKVLAATTGTGKTLSIVHNS